MSDATEKNCKLNTDSEEEYFIDRLGSDSTRPIIIELNIAGRNHQMELDTGAAFSIISERTEKAQFADVKRRKSSILLKTYLHERINVLGQLHVRVTYGVQQAPLVLLVVEGDGPSLVGRNWL